MVPGIDGEDSVQGLFSGRHLAQKALGCRQVEQELDLVGFRGHGPLIVGLREFVLISLSACAKPFVADEFVLTMADHVLGDEIMHLVREHHPEPGGATLCVDFKLDTIFDMGDATKVQAHGGLIQSIGKEIETYNCIDTGVFICTLGLMDGIERVYEKTGDASLSDGVGALAAKSMMRVLDVGDGFWQDVDTPEMLAHATEALTGRA